MAYNTEELKQQAIDRAKKSKCVWIEELVGLMPCSKPTFYEHFPNESNDYKKIVEILERNRVELKNQQRKKWFDSDNATLQIAHYKLIATPEERKRLTLSYQEIKGKIDNNIIHDIPEGVMNAIKQGFREAIKNNRPEVDREDNLEG